MDDTHAVIRKFERMMGISNITEVREDTKGALVDEVQRSMEIHSQKSFVKPENKKGRIIGYSIYNPQDKTIKFVYTPKYRLIRFINRTHSRIKNYFSKRN